MGGFDKVAGPARHIPCLLCMSSLTLYARNCYSASHPANPVPQDIRTAPRTGDRIDANF